jgi:hypothetical protein
MLYQIGKTQDPGPKTSTIQSAQDLPQSGANVAHFYKAHVYVKTIAGRCARRVWGVIDSRMQYG